MKGVSLGSDAFFPFGDNIERAHKSGVEYIAQAGGSVRDDHVIDTCDKYGITMAFTAFVYSIINYFSAGCKHGFTDMLNHTLACKIRVYNPYKKSS